MKKLLMTVLTVLTSGAAFALPVGNPSDASLLCDGICWEGHCGDMCDPCLTWCDAFSVRFGYYGDFVLNRHLEIDRSDYTRDVDHSAFITNAGLLVGNFYDRFDIFVTLGATRIFLEGNREIWVDNTAATAATFNIETETYFSYSVGARGTIWECGCTAIGAEFQYFATKPHIFRVVNDGAITNPPHSINAKWYEWQFGLGISYRINFLVPYAAIKWASGKMDLGDAVGLFDNAGTLTLWQLETGKTWGYAVGVTLVDCEKMSLTAEVRFADELASYANAQIRF